MPFRSTSDSSPTTISLIRYLVSAIPLGNQGTDVQVKLPCKVFNKDIKSQTAYTWNCINTFKSSMSLIAE